MALLNPVSSSTYLRSESLSRSSVPVGFNNFNSSSCSNSLSASIRCAPMENTMVVEKEVDAAVVDLQRPDAFGRFGKFGGKYVPETLMSALTELEAAFKSLAADDEFQMVAEFYIPSPIVKASKVYFVRCLQQIDASNWLVADISLETLFPWESSEESHQAA